MVGFLNFSRNNLENPLVFNDLQRKNAFLDFIKNLLVCNDLRAVFEEIADFSVHM